MLFDTENKSSAADFVPEEKKYIHIVATEDDSTITTKPAKWPTRLRLVISYENSKVSGSFIVYVSVLYV